MNIRAVARGVVRRYRRQFAAGDQTKSNLPLVPSNTLPIDGGAFGFIAGARVLQVACADGEAWTEGEPTGSHAPRRGSALVADWELTECDLSDATPNSWDVLACLNASNHGASVVETEHLIDRMIQIAKRGILVGVRSEGHTQHSPLPDEERLREYVIGHSDIGDVESLGYLNGNEILLADVKPNGQVNKNDLSVTDQLLAYNITDLPDEFVRYLEFSRRKVGFFPRTMIRAHEYPWFLDKMRGARGKYIVDLGAGICALPLLLAERGATVETVDYHPNERLLTDSLSWDEWGYMDYSRIDNRILSHNQDMTTFTPRDEPDFVYSVSVIEHMPSALRRKAIANIASWSRTGTSLLLSVDLYPETSDLWNRSESKIVDKRGHGTLRDLENELASAGFSVSVEKVIRATPKSNTDVAFLVGDFTG